MSDEKKLDLTQTWNSGNVTFDAVKMNITTIEKVNFSHFADAPQSYTFAARDGGKIFSIHPDGRIERGPAFTTDEEASLRFWEWVEKTGMKMYGKTEK